MADMHRYTVVRDGKITSDTYEQITRDHPDYANVTTILAALIMFQFGSGPVKGFAWTLSIGVITSVFTAVVITQVLIGLWFRATRPKALPIV